MCGVTEQIAFSAIFDDTIAYHIRYSWKYQYSIFIIIKGMWKKLVNGNQLVDQINQSCRPKQV